MMNLVRVVLGLALLCLNAAGARAVTVTNVAAGEYHSLFLKSDGSLWGMGYNPYGELGDGTTNDSFAPESIVSDGAVLIAGGGDHTLFLKSDGSLWGMGYNGYGQLGDGTNNNHLTPIEIVPSGVAGIAAGDSHSLFLKSDGSLWGMGYNGNGELGDGTTSNRYAPEQIVSGGVVAIAAGWGHSLFLKSDGSLWGMGYNQDGELGDGTTSSRYAPEEIVPGGVAVISTRYKHSLFVKSDGSLWGMGHNNVGQLGDGTTVNRTAPVEIVSNSVTAVAAGENHSLLLKSDGSLWGMGRSGDGQLGLGAAITQTYTPAEIVAGDVAAIAAGDFHSLFLKSDGTLWGMGYDGDGELGDATGFNSSYVYAPELINAVTFSANPATGASPLTVRFAAPGVDLYGTPLTSWTWSFGDGSTNTAQSPSHTYLGSGSFSPALQATNSAGVAVPGAGPTISALGLVVNGGFETGNFSGWSRSGNTDFSSVVSGTAGGDSVHSGQGAAQFGPSTLGYISQTLPTTPGASYLISCWLDADDSGTGNEFVVSWDGTTLLNLTNLSALGWQNFLFVASAAGANAPLKFGFQSPSGYLHFDDASVIGVWPVAAWVDATNGPFPLTLHFTSPNQDSAGHTITNRDWHFGDGSPDSPVQNPAHTYFQLGTFTPALVGVDDNGGLAAWSGTPVTVSTPTLQFTANPTNGAAPLAVQFSARGVDSGGSAITNWHWDFGDGSTGKGQNLSHTYAVQGTFVPNLEATNSYGLSVIASGPAIQSAGLIENPGFEVYDPSSGAIEGWTIGNTNGQGAGADISQSVAHSGTNSLDFYGYESLAAQKISTAPGAGYLVSFWTYFNAEYSDSGAYLLASWDGDTIAIVTNLANFIWTNVQVYVEAAGTNAVLQFTGSSTTGDNYLYLDDVSVTPAEVEPATATPASGPIRLAVQFRAPNSDSFGQRVTAWDWDFGDGSPHSSAQNPSHTYTSVGTFTPVLAATNNQGAEVPGPANLAITTRLPSVEVAASPTNGSSPLAVQFTTPGADNSGQTLTSWNWNFGDGTTGSGQNPMHTYYGDSGASPFVPALIGTNSAGVEVLGILPAVSVTYSPGLVVNGGFETGDFTGWTTNGVGAEIALGFGHSGDYAVIFITNGANAFGGRTSLSQTIPTTVGAGYALSFALSPDGSQNAMSASWNGAAVFSQTYVATPNIADYWTNFQFFVVATGPSSVLQFLFNPPGGQTTFTELLDDVSLFPAEVEPFTATPLGGPIPLRVQFNAPAADTAGNAIEHWDWDFGDGTPHSPLQSPFHTYPSVGSFVPVLSATGANGAPVPAESGPLIVTALPTVSFTATPTNGSNPLTVQFDSQGIDSSGRTIVAWNWSFGDGATGTEQNPTHNYEAAGAFSPALLARNSAGVEVLGIGPAVSVGFDSGLVLNGGFETGNLTNWTATAGAVNSGSHVHSGTYSFSDLSGTLQTLSQTLATAPGISYLLSVWVGVFEQRANEFEVSWNGTTLMNDTNLPAVGWTNFQFLVAATETNTVLQFGFKDASGIYLDDISVLPTVQFTANPTNGTAPVAVHFGCPAVDTTGETITNWNWDFGDGSSGSSKNPSHTYTGFGVFEPVLAVMNSAGVERLGFGPTITVSPPEVAFTASPTNGFNPLKVQFASGSVDSSGQTITGWSWDFGDGSTSAAENPLHTYQLSGVFSPVLLATNTLGVQVLGVGPSISVAFYSGIVSNGGFETGTFAGWGFPDGQTGASVTTDSAYVHSGAYGAKLGPSSIFYMSQTLATTPGAAYELSFWLSGNGSAANQFLVEWNGNTLTNMIDIPLSGWTNFQFAVTATSSSTVLEFGYDNRPSWFGLDDIGVLPATTGVTGPALTVGRLAGGHVQISWPATSGLELETATSLAPPISWQPVTNGIVVSGGVSSLMITNPPGGLNHFYRLLGM